MHQAAQVAQPFGGGDTFEIDPGQIGRGRGGGQPLPPAVLAKMEAAFGADFSGVRVHVGPQAARIGAVAFTMGDDLYFAPGKFQPDSAQGQQLIGHELAHVIQQRQGRVRAPGSGIAVVQDRALEAEADRLGMRAASHAIQRRAVAPRAGGVQISAPVADGPGRYRLSAMAGGASVGSVIVNTNGGKVAEITDLTVAPARRDEGIGQMLLSSAARAGLQRGHARVALHADDNGSGRLTRWYRAMGFSEVAGRRQGQPRLEASAIRLAAAPVQRQIASPAALRRPGGVPNVGGRPIQRASRGSSLSLRSSSDDDNASSSSLPDRGSVPRPGRPKPVGQASASKTPVILIAFYMSGDRNTLASALALNPRACVCVVGPETEPRTLEMQGYFRAKHPTRTYCCLTESRAETEAIMLGAKRPDGHADNLATVAWRAGIEGPVSFHPPSHGTVLVAEGFKHRGARDVLSAFWSIPELEGRFAAFLAHLGIDTRKRYVFLWCKKGNIGDEKSYHYSDRRSWAMLAAGIAMTRDYFPIFVGENIGLSTEPSLTEFWSEWEKLFGEKMPRDVQLAFWAYIARHMGANCRAIGMRSGMIEVPALLGIPTLYLEEVENEQRNRMAKWLGVVDTWYRAILLRPPGYMQSISWLGEMTNARLYPLVRQTMPMSAAELGVELKWRTRLLIGQAFRHCMKGQKAPDWLLDRLCAYVGYDIDYPAFAMKQAAIETICEWVTRGRRDDGSYEQLAQKIVGRTLPLAIEGGLVATARAPKGSGKPSEAELERLRKQKAERKALEPPDKTAKK